jgi:hypothetical protein
VLVILRALALVFKLIPNGILIEYRTTVIIPMGVATTAAGPEV